MPGTGKQSTVASARLASAHTPPISSHAGTDALNVGSRDTLNPPYPYNNSGWLSEQTGGSRARYQ
jgi:hypothetical protein